VLKIPERDYVHYGQVRHLQNLSERRDRYIGGIVSPTEPELLRNDLKSFCVSMGYPVIFVDIDPFDAAEDYPANTAFVGYAPESIGRCAADYVGEHAREPEFINLFNM
jgi:ribose transport system substrate-binding protein